MGKAAEMYKAFEAGSSTNSHRIFSDVQSVIKMIKNVLYTSYLMSTSPPIPPIRPSRSTGYV